MEDRLPHKLAAIVYADVAGYSRLTGSDELGTHRQLMIVLDYASETIEQSQGRVLRYAGDAILAEFSSVVAAVKASMAIQTGLAERGAEVPDQRRVQIRIGINLGEVIQDRGELFGDGVNVAARLEAEARPGGVCISEIVHDQIEGKIEDTFTDAGEQTLKNIARPVRTFHWSPVGSTALAPSAQGPLPEKPSIAVLPFDNMSADAEQDYFAAGISEDIITELSKFRSLFVIARNSSFAFQGRSLSVMQVGEKLGVRYVLEGSVRRAGSRVRITAQLIDAVEDRHVWAERYDREVDDIFAVQDEVTRAIVLAIEPELASTERQRARRKPVESLGAWESYQRGLWHTFQFSKQELETAISLHARAIDLDPTFAPAFGALAYCLYYYVVSGFSSQREADLERASEAGRQAVALDDSDPWGHTALGRIYTLRGEHDTAIASCDRALALNPNFAFAYLGKAHSLWQHGRPREAIGFHDEAIRLSPRDPMLWVFLASKSIAMTLLGRYEEAADLARQSARQPNANMFASLAEMSALGNLGKVDEARAAYEKLKLFKPDASLSFVDEALAFTHGEDRDHFVKGLSVAGLID